jgi:hypothetical protein
MCSNIITSDNLSHSQVLTTIKTKTTERYKSLLVVVEFCLLQKAWLTGSHHFQLILKTKANQPKSK